MKKTFCILLMIIFLCGCATTNSANSANSASSVVSAASANFTKSAVSSNIEKSHPIDMSFDSFYGESSYDVADFINNPRDNQLYEDLHTIYRFEKHNGQLLLTGISDQDGSGRQGPFLALNDPDNHTWGELKFSEFFQRAIVFLCDEDAIKQCFRENGIDNIQKIVILDGPSEEAGYVITAITEKQSYFMTVPLSNEKYGDYIFQKVYTKDEYLKIFNPHPAKVFIDEKEATFSTTPLLGDSFLEMELFEFLDAFGVQYTYDKDHKVISFNDKTLQMEEYKDGWLEVQLLKDGKHVENVGEVRYEKGKYIGDIWLYSMLESTLGYNMDLHYDDYSVWIVKS